MGCVINSQQYAHLLCGLNSSFAHVRSPQVSGFFRGVRTLSKVVFLIALAATILLWPDLQDFLSTYKWNTAAFQHLAGMLLFIASGFCLMMGARRWAFLLFGLGVYFSARAGWTLPEGAPPPWARS